MANNEVLKMSENGHHEYCATVIKVENLTPIENSDHLATIDVNGLKTVVDKRVVSEGDVVIYISNECQIAIDFLSANNMYNFSNFELNSNRAEVDKLIAENKIDDAKALCGFFEKNGRVRTIKLRGVQSFGITISPKDIIKWQPQFEGFDFNKYIGTDFDMVGDRFFVKAYVPPIQTDNRNSNATKSEHDKGDRLNRLVPGEFVFHYDTQLLAKNMDLINPDTEVAISVKMHGTSFIFANVKCNHLMKIPFYKRIWNKIVSKKFKNLKFKDSYVDFGELYSSRKILKNAYEYRNKKNNYTTDEYGYFAQKLHGKIPNGMTIYGEIVGFKPRSTSFEQKNYDYGCMPGECKLMIYRITIEDEKGVHKELAVNEVKGVTHNLRMNYPELSDCLIEIPILYIGNLNDLLHLPIDDHWKEKAVEELSNLKQFHMNEKEPMCKNKVPREGIVIRIMNDPKAEAFKLKCIKFLTHEAKEIDEGNVDTEMQNNVW